MKTVLEVIQSTSAYFAKHGVENPRLNIEHLLAHVLGGKRMDLYLQFDRPLSEKELDPLRDLVRRRSAGEPLQHLLGTVEFLGRTFLSDKRALIPRPETEHLCDILLRKYKDAKPSFRVLDVGAGSGVIALTLAGEWPDAQVEAVDISHDALALACENSARLALDRVKFYASDLLENVTGKFGLIVANLPYVPRPEIASLSREVQCDPVTALDGGETGIELLLRFIKQALAHLNGELALEIGHDQAAPLQEALLNLGYREINVATDYQGRNRFVFAKHG